MFARMTDIVAVPLTVLAAERINLNPPLASDYTAAIHDLPFVLVDKVGLAFNTDVFGSTPDNLVVTRHLDTARFGMGLAKLAGTPMMNLIVGGELAPDLEAERAVALEPGNCERSRRREASP